MTLRLSILLLSALTASAVILPADRMGAWARENVGVGGGIPDSSTMTQYGPTLPANSSLSVINTAIANCPSNQVVQLAAGPYTLGGNINMKSGVVLRGAGPGMTNTVLTFTSGGIHVGSDTYIYNVLANLDYSGGASVNWTAGYSQNSSNITLSSTSGLTPGQVICLDQINDPGLACNAGFEGANNIGRTPWNRLQEQETEVQAVNGNVVTIWPPVAAPYWASTNSPQAWWVPKGDWTTRVGIENLTVNNSGGQGSGPWNADIAFGTARDCWVKNVETTYGYWSHIAFYGSFRCEIRHCYAYNTANAAQTSYGYVPSYTSALLIEDNIFEKVVTDIVGADLASQSVYAYNYGTNNYYTASVGYLFGLGQSHEGGVSMILWEGNCGSLSDWDLIHGGGSYQTLFRNRLIGWAPYTFGGGESVHNVLCEQIDPTNRYCSSVGNVLGTPGKHTAYASYPGHDSGGAHPIYTAGWINHAYDGNGHVTPSTPDDPNVWATFYTHMDYDVVTAGITYNPTNADVSLPASLYLTSKPAYFGTLTWPPYNPTNGAFLSVYANAAWTNIPAGYRFVHGVDPPTGSNPPAPLVLYFGGVK